MKKSKKEIASEFKHVVIGAVRESDEFESWLQHSKEMTLEFKQCTNIEYAMVGNIITIVCEWTSRDAFDKFWEFTRLDDGFESHFAWHCQHHCDA